MNKLVSEKKFALLLLTSLIVIWSKMSDIYLIVCDSKIPAINTNINEINNLNFYLKGI